MWLRARQNWYGSLTPYRSVYWLKSPALILQTCRTWWTTTFQLNIFTASTSLRTSSYLHRMVRGRNTSGTIKNNGHMVSIEEGFIQKRRQRSSLLVRGRTWMPGYTFSSKDDLKKICWKNIHFGSVVVFCGGNWKINQMFRSVHSAKCPFVYSSISSNHPGAKFVVRQGIE